MLTPKISDIFNPKSQETPQSIKRSSSMLSPAEDENNAKKQVTEQSMGKASIGTHSQIHEDRSDLQLILHEFKSLKNTVDDRVTRLEVAITKQEEKFTRELHKLKDTI